MKTIYFFLYIFYSATLLAQFREEVPIDCKKIKKIQYEYSVNYDIISKYNKTDTFPNALTKEPYYSGIRNLLDTLVIDIMLEQLPVVNINGEKIKKPLNEYEDIFSVCSPRPCDLSPEMNKFQYNWRDTAFMSRTRHIREELTGGIYMVKVLTLKRGRIIRTKNYLAIVKMEMYYKGYTRYPSGDYKTWCLVDVDEMQKKGYDIVINNKKYSIVDFFSQLLYPREYVYRLAFESKQVATDTFGYSSNKGDITFRAGDEPKIPELLRKKGLCFVLKQAESYRWYY